MQGILHGQICCCRSSGPTCMHMNGHQISCCVMEMHTRGMGSGWKTSGLLRHTQCRWSCMMQVHAHMVSVCTYRVLWTMGVHAWTMGVCTYMRGPNILLWSQICCCKVLWTLLASILDPLAVYWPDGQCMSTCTWTMYVCMTRGHVHHACGPCTCTL